jgi:hypothetical protein
MELTKEDFFDPVNYQVAYLKQIPHNKQIEVLRSPHKNKVVVCGRRAGKSQMIAGEINRGTTLELYNKQIVIAPTYKQSMIVNNKILDIMSKAGVLDDIQKVVKSPHPQIVFKNGCIIDFGSADNPDSLRGENYDRIFLDEGEFIKEDAMSAIRPLIYDTGAPMWITTTPWRRNFVWEYWKRGIAGDEDWGSFNYCYLDNPYITDEGKKEIEKDIEEWGENSLYVQAEIFGNYTNNSDCYFDMDDILFCVVKGCDHGLPHPKKRYVAGVDCAGEGEDKSVCIVIEIDDMKLEVRVINIRYLDKNKPRELVSMLVDVDEKYNLERLYIDKTGIGEGPSDWIGIEIGDEKVEAIRFSSESKMNMYSNLKMWLQKRKLKEVNGKMIEVPSLMLPDNKLLLKEMIDLRYERMPNKTIKIHHPEGAKYHDDFADALALACLWLKEEEISEYEAFIF